MTYLNPDSDQLLAFGRALHKTIVNNPFGSLPKSELELLMFSELISSGILDVDTTSNFELARQLKCSPTKASTMVFNHRLRGAFEDEAQVQEALAKVTKVVVNARSSKDGDVTLNVEDRFWRDQLIEQLKRAEVYTDTSFNRERVTLDAKLFYAACPKLFGPDGEKIKAAAKRASGKKVELLKALGDSVATGAAENVGGATTKGVFGAVSIHELANLAHSLPF